jgi:hypothetical protein
MQGIEIGTMSSEVTCDGLSNEPLHTLNRNIKSDLCSRLDVNRKLMDYEYTIVQSSSLVVEVYRDLLNI